jgi:transposase
MALEECSMSKRAYKTYTKEIKLEAIRLADESDKPVTQVARELGLRVNQIYKWKEQLDMKQEDAFPGKGKATAKNKDAEIRRLKKALAASQEENEFLKKRRCSSRRTSHEICSDS